jgi:hypothetical protein
MLFYAIPQKNVNPLAHALIERFGRSTGDPRLARAADADPVVGRIRATLLTLFAQAPRQPSMPVRREKLTTRKSRQLLRAAADARSAKSFTSCA